MFRPAETGSGASEIVTPRSAWGCAVTLSEPVSLPGTGSVTLLVVVAVSVIVVPPGAPGSDVTRSVNACGPRPAPTPSVWALTAPVPPAAGVAIESQIGGAENDTNVVF